MCGIAGLVAGSGVGDVSLGLSMLSQLVHRGPDGGYIHADGSVVLGSRRLAIVNVAGGEQPVFAADANIVAVFNGEIYNHPELRRELEQLGHRIPHGSDAEIIPAAFLQWGMSFAQHFNGQFAIALWDGKNRELILARDRVGMKPLFFTHASNGDLLFASEVKALFVHDGIRRALDPAGIAQVFSFWTLIDGQSPFAGVHQVEAGYVYRFASNRRLVEKVKYWEIPYSGGTVDKYSNDGEATEACRATLRDSVALRLRADVEIGTYTSGGIDSAIVNQIAYRNLNHHETQTFLMQFESDYYDESPYQNIVAKHFGLTPNEVRCSNKDIADGFEKAIFHAEAPIFRTAPISNLYLSKAVQQKGIKVVLTGEGADEVAWGYDIYREAKVRRFWSRFPESRVRPQLFRRLYSYLPQFQNPRFFNLSVDFFKTDLQCIDDPLYSHLTRIANCRATHSFFSEAMLSKLEGHNPVDLLRARLPEDFERRSHLERCQYLEMQTLLTGYLLASQGDRMQSAHGVEGRYPYLDHNVIAFMARLPESMKLRGLRDKFIVREAYRNDLPAEITHRPKFAYRAPEAEAFLDSLDTLLAANLSSDRIEEAGLFDPARVAKLLQRFKAARKDRFNTRDNMAFVGIYSTQVLFDQFVRRFDTMRQSDATLDTSLVDWDRSNLRRRLRPMAHRAG